MARKCDSCEDPQTMCGDCSTVALKVSGQDLEDVLSALTFFLEEWPKKEPNTFRNMKKLIKQGFDVLKANKKVV